MATLATSEFIGSPPYRPSRLHIFMTRQPATTINGAEIDQQPGVNPPGCPGLPARRNPRPVRDSFIRRLTPVPSAACLGVAGVGDASIVAIRKDHPQVNGQPA